MRPCGDHARATENAVELARLAREHELPMYGAFGAFLEGWATAQGGAPGGGVADMRRGVENLRAQNVLVFDGLLKVALAEAEAPLLVPRAKRCEPTSLTQALEGLRKDWRSVRKRACVWRTRSGKSRAVDPSPRRPLRSGARVSEGPGSASSRNAKVQTCPSNSMTRNWRQWPLSAETGARA